MVATWNANVTWLVISANQLTIFAPNVLLSVTFFKLNMKTAIAVMMILFNVANMGMRS